MITSQMARSTISNQPYIIGESPPKFTDRLTSKRNTLENLYEQMDESYSLIEGQEDNEEEQKQEDDKYEAMIIKEEEE